MIDIVKYILIVFLPLVVLPTVIYMAIRYGIIVVDWVKGWYYGISRPIKKRMYVAIEHANHIKEYVNDKYCSECPFGKKGIESPFIVRIRRSGRYIFLTPECQWMHVYGSNKKCDIEVCNMFEKEVFDIYKRTGKSIGSVDEDKIRYAIDSHELFDDSNIIYMTKNKVYKN